MANMDNNNSVEKKCKPVRSKVSRRGPNIPVEYTDMPLLVEMSKALPSNYNFELSKTLWRANQLRARRLALQFPEGLLMFAATIADILHHCSGGKLSCYILCDPTYGACCVDDLLSVSLNCDLLVHYGHSCLVPVNKTKPSANFNVMYVFVDIKFDLDHFVLTLLSNFPRDKKVILFSTIQFVTSLQRVVVTLTEDHGRRVALSQSSPLSPGEVLGCTAPIVSSEDVLLYVGDGRFHLEAMMLANPNVQLYRYDPYSRRLTHESYDHVTMRRMRWKSIEQAKNASTFGVIVGTLGRQGSNDVRDNIIRQLKRHNKTVVPIYMAEVSMDKLNVLAESGIDAFVQIACPRLSIDWGYLFEKPLLTPYEVMVSLGDAAWLNDDRYPMDFYANDSLGNWTPNHKCNTNCSCE